VILGFWPSLAIVACRLLFCSPYSPDVQAMEKAKAGVRYLAVD
jgi:hypothetical protein